MLPLAKFRLAKSVLRLSNFNIKNKPNLGTEISAAPSGSQPEILH